MKRFTVLMICAAFLAAGCSHSARFSVKGDLNTVGFDKDDTDSVMVYSHALDKPLETAVRNGEFSLHGKTDKPYIARLRGNGRISRIGLDFFLESGTIMFRNGQAVGTPLNDAVAGFMNRMEKLRTQYEENPADYRNACTEEVQRYVMAHLNDPTGPYVLKMNRRLINMKIARELDEKISPEMKEAAGITVIRTNTQPAH